MSLISVGEITEYWKKISDWIDGKFNASPKVNVSNLPEIDEDGGLKVHVQNDSFAQYEVKRIILTPNAVANFTFSTTFNRFEILNLGTSEVFIALNAEPSINGDNSILIPPKTGFSLSLPCPEIRAISEGNSQMQILGLK